MVQLKQRALHWTDLKDHLEGSIGPNTTLLLSGGHSLATFALRVALAVTLLSGVIQSAVYDL